jgi:hypothetical protein
MYTHTHTMQCIFKRYIARRHLGATLLQNMYRGWRERRYRLARFWGKMWDPTHRQFYYFNRSSNQFTWEQPKGFRESFSQQLLARDRVIKCVRALEKKKEEEEGRGGAGRRRSRDRRRPGGRPGGRR